MVWKAHGMILLLNNYRGIKDSTRERRPPNARPVKREKETEYVLTLHCIPHKYNDYINPAQDMYTREDIHHDMSIVGDTSMTSVIMKNVRMRQNILKDYYNEFISFDFQLTRLVDYKNLVYVLDAAKVKFQEDVNLPPDATEFKSEVEKLPVVEEYKKREHDSKNDLNIIGLVLKSRGAITEQNVFYMRKNFMRKRIVFLSDYHGSLHSLAETLDYMYRKNMFENDNCHVKNDVIVICSGDIVDRTMYSVETLFILLCLKIHNPNNVYITLGNHEVEPKNWLEIQGLDRELKGEYHDQARHIRTKITEVFHWLPASMIIDTDVGKLQVVHGCHDRIFDGQQENQWELLYCEMFKEFVKEPENKYHKTFKALCIRGKSCWNTHDLMWRDITTNHEIRKKRQPKTSNLREPVYTAEVHKYLDEYKIDMIIKGHQDQACCSLAIHPNIEKDNAAEWFHELQKENSDNLFTTYGPYKQSITVWGNRQQKDSSGQNREAMRGKFVYNPNDFQNKKIYDLWILDLSEEDGITKTLMSTTKKNDIVAVVHSSSTTSKRSAPIMLPTTFLMVDERGEMRKNPPCKDEDVTDKRIHTDNALVLGLDHDCASTMMEYFEQDNSQVVKPQEDLINYIQNMFPPQTMRKDITIYIFSFSHRQTEEIDKAMVEKSAFKASRNEILCKWAERLRLKGFNAYAYTGWKLAPKEYGGITKPDDLENKSKGSIWKALHSARPDLPMVLIDDNPNMLRSAAEEAKRKVLEEAMPRLLWFNEPVGTINRVDWK